MIRQCNVSNLSVSTRASTTYTGALYSEVAMPVPSSKHYSITRVYPKLADEFTCSVTPKDLESGIARPYPTNSDGSRLPLNLERLGTLIKKLCIKHPGASEYVVKWKGLTVEEVEKNLLPFATHYKIQVLLLDEDQRRHLIANEEFTERVCMQIQHRYGKPLREKLLSGHTLNVLSQRAHEIRSGLLSTSHVGETSCIPRSVNQSMNTSREILDGNARSLCKEAESLSRQKSVSSDRASPVPTSVACESSLNDSVHTVLPRVVVSEHRRIINSPLKKNVLRDAEVTDSLAESHIESATHSEGDSLAHSICGDVELLNFTKGE